jgi:hypothetical protein
MKAKCRGSTATGGTPKQPNVRHETFSLLTDLIGPKEARNRGAVLTFGAIVR